MVKPSVISTFAGCGGSSLGFRMAGFRELLAVEWNDDAVAMFRLNFPDVPVYHGDIRKLTAEECIGLAGIKAGELDVLDGSPPCQGFSTAGRRRYGDPRNSLFIEFARLLEGLQPKCFVMENVTGMVKGYMKQAYLEIVKILRGCGYRVKGQVLNAMYFGVPQSRQRVILIGTRDNLKTEPSHPKPQTKPRTVREAIGHLPTGGAGNHQPEVLKAWAASAPGISLQKTCHFVGSFQSVRLDPNRPSPTQIRSHLNWHWAVARQLTIHEAACLQGFPPSYKFPVTRNRAKQLVGNSVPPLLMKAIAKHIKQHILMGKKNK